MQNAVLVSEMMHETLAANRLPEQSVKDEGTIGLAGIYPI
jgi:hypothetical protein